MKLLRVVTENVRNLPDGDHHLVERTSGAPLPTVLVTGAMASGKTGFLEAIIFAKERAAGYGGPPEARSFLRHGRDRGRILLTLLLGERERRDAGVGDSIVELDVALADSRPEIAPGLAKLLSSYSHAPSAKMEYFHARRRLDDTLGPDVEPGETEEAFLRVSTHPDKYRGVVPWLRARLGRDMRELGARLSSEAYVAAGHAPDSLAPFRRGLQAMCPALRLAGLGDDGDPSFMRSDGSTSSVRELSDAEKDAVLLSATFQRIGLAHSIVLVDRPELYAHPDDHARWLGALSDLGDDNQLVVATTSPVLCAPREHEAIRLSAPGAVKSR